VGHTYAYGISSGLRIAICPVPSLNRSTAQALTLSVQSVDSLNPRDPALAPPAMRSQTRMRLSHLTRNDIISHRSEVLWAIREARIGLAIAGTVLLEFIITKDGHVRDPEPISSPDPSLPLPLSQSISRWEFKPGSSTPACGSAHGIRSEY